MSDLNRASLMGRLGKSPEIRTLDSGDIVANFSVATSEHWKDKNTAEKKERTEWHNVVAYGPVAKLAQQYLAKGSRVHIEGVIRTRKWQDKSGNDRWSTEIVLSGFDARLDIIDWPEGNPSKAVSQGGAYEVDNMPPSRDLDDEIPF